MEQINKNFLAEIFKKMFTDLEMMGIVDRFIDFKLIPSSERGYKFILKEAKSMFKETGKLPSIGVVSQKYAADDDVQLSLSKIQDADDVEFEVLTIQLEVYIKKNMMLLLSKELADLWNEGKAEEAFELNLKKAEEICSFSLRKENNMFINVFSGFDETMEELSKETEEHPKLPFGIDALDQEYVGREVGDIGLWIMRSGIGKSTVLRWLGYQAAIEGHPVLHIQLEENKNKVRVKYTQMFTSKSYSALKRGDFKEKELNNIKKFVKDMQDYGADITIYSFKSFGDATVVDVRNIILDYIKSKGYPPRLVLLDSLDLLYTGFNKAADMDPKPKTRLQLCAQRLKNIAEEFSLNIDTATQANDVAFEVWNDPEKVIDRSNTAGDRNLVNPFSWVFTGNQTLAERERSEMRIYKDKVRDYANDRPTFLIKSKYSNGIFYDKPGTIKAFGEDSYVEMTTTKKKRGKSKEKENNSVEVPLG